VATASWVLARLLLLARGPYRLDEQEAKIWMGRHAMALTELRTVEGVEVSRLGSAASHAREWDWLIEVHCVNSEDARRTAEAREFRDLMAELRQLGPQPRVVLVSGPESPTG